MAMLTPPTNSGNPFADVIGNDLAPAGTFAATILDIKDELNVVRQKFQSTDMETLDMCTFLFGFRDAAGKPHRVSSKRYRISGHEKSALYAFLKSLLGKAPPFNWDYLELKGSKCLLTVEHLPRRDGSGVFAAIASISPLPVGMAVGQTADNRPQTVDLGNALPPAPAAAGPSADADASLPLEEDLPF